jgi:hypothetical protein
VVLRIRYSSSAEQKLNIFLGCRVGMARKSNAIILAQQVLIEEQEFKIKQMQLRSSYFTISAVRELNMLITYCSDGNIVSTYVSAHEIRLIASHTSYELHRLYYDNFKEFVTHFKLHKNTHHLHFYFGDASIEYQSPHRPVLLRSANQQRVVEVPANEALKLMRDIHDMTEYPITQEISTGYYY